MSRILIAACLVLLTYAGSHAQNMNESYLLGTWLGNCTSRTGSTSWGPVLRENCEAQGGLFSPFTAVSTSAVPAYSCPYSKGKHAELVKRLDGSYACAYDLVLPNLETKQ